MKKILACMSLVFALSAGATALADENVIDSGAYDPSDNSLSITGAGATNMETILITDETGKDILFVDQNDEGLGHVQGVTRFLLKGTGKLKAGTYNVRMHDTDTDVTTTKTFTVAEGAQNIVDVSNQAFTYEYYNTHTERYEYDAGFKVENKDLSNVRYIAITNVTENKTAYIKLDGTYKANANVAIRINNIPKGVTVSVALTATDGTSN